LSWLIPLISILIKLDSKGPVFFLQTRNGYKYREFKCIKFRSMVVNSKADILTATKGDVRVTRIGKFLRKTSLDEMPQFINVLLGDMSVVGPRPHMIKENIKYAKSVDRFMLRHTVKPGITGLAQINGYRGEIEEIEDIINRIKYDIYYLENWSVILDIKIIINTSITFLKGGEDKAY
jgi:putative colanic acid biosysnthesis UDP-glucose lipid carrier transferase